MSAWRSGLVAVYAAVLLGLSAACGGGGEPDWGPLATVVPERPTVPYRPPPTATPLPTFTPVPTATPLPTATPFVIRTPTATTPPSFTLPDPSRFTPTPEPVVEEPTAAPEDELPENAPDSPPEPEPGETPVAPTPVPTPYGMLVENDQGRITFVAQTLQPAQSINVDVSHWLSDPGSMPDPVEYVSSTVPYVLWAVIFDTSEAPPDWSMDYHVMWWDVSLEERPMLMHQHAVELTSRTPMYAQSVGRPGGIRGWPQGFYRVVLVDDTFAEVLGWDFEVR